MVSDGVDIFWLVCVLGAVYTALKYALGLHAAGPSARLRRAWLLTGVVSLTMATLGLFFFGRLLLFGLEHELGREEVALDRWAAKFFAAYCVADLAFGSFEYVELIDWESGWSHHSFYLVMLVLLLWRGHAHFFSAGLIEELPTVVLAWSRLRGGFGTTKRASGDATTTTTTKAVEAHHRRWPFAVLYFALRILYHTVATFEALPHSTLAFVVGLVVLRQHLWWFAGWWRGALDVKITTDDDDKRDDIKKKTQKEAPPHRETTTSSSPKPYRLSLRLKLALLASMIVVEVATTAHVARVSFYKRMWEFSTFAGAIGLVVAVVILTFQTVAIFVDTYTRHFISLAIAEKQVIYNISWEDPRVEREALALGSEDVVLTISSAGCNVLDYLVDGPRCVVAADLNEAQLAVLDLKLACLEAQLPRSEFFALWGRSNPQVFLDSYQKQLRPRLRRAASVTYWDEIGDALFRDNFMFSGTSGLVAFLLMLVSRPLGVSGALQRNLGGIPGLSLVDGEGLPSFFFKSIVRLLSKPSVWHYVAPLVGVPPEQVNLVARAPELFSDRIVEIIQKRMWTSDNYFYHGYLTGQFDDYPKCPRYMSTEYYDVLLRYFADPQEARRRCVLFHGSWGDAPVPDGCDGFTFVSLLDSMDWMPPDLASKLVARAVARLKKKKEKSSKRHDDGRFAAPGEPRVFWRSYAPGPSMERTPSDLFTPHSPVLAHLEPVELLDYDRVGWYLSQWVATPRDFLADDALADALCPGLRKEEEEEASSEASASHTTTTTTTTTPKKYVNSLLDDLHVCLAMAAHALRRDKDVATFYKSQGSRYDGFREALLPDRDTLLRYALPWARLPRIVAASKATYALACVGCGTARDLEFIADHLAAVCASTKSRVALVDLSPELLSVAKDRVHRIGLGDFVDFFVADVAATGGAAKDVRNLLRHNVAFVTCSYCLTMIPAWPAAVDALASFLVPKEGFLGVVDFTQRFNRQANPLERLYKAWFALDGVYFNRAHVDYLASKTTPYYYHEHQSRTPYTPWYPTHYLFVGTLAPRPKRRSIDTTTTKQSLPPNSNNNATP